MQFIGDKLDRLGRLRNFADYEIPASVSFKNATKARQAIGDAESALKTLDAIEADPARRAAAIAAIKAAWP